MTALTRPRYDQETIDKGLMAVAAQAGSHKAAHEMLAEAGIDIPKSTLQHWTSHTHAARYLEIRKDQAPALRERLAVGFDDIVQISHGIQRKLLARIDQEIDNLKPVDLGTTARNLATVQGISTDKPLALRGQPTTIIEHRAPDQILKQLARRYGQAIDSTATEIPEAQQVAGPQATSAQAGQ